jgi:phosphatidylserine/phosphatidylglycerophosphate/cardiolipin synthase-like enzyme
MKLSPSLVSIVVAFAIALVMCTYAQAVDVPVNTTVHVYFNPHGGCTDAIVREIGKAKAEILLQAYSFTSKPIAEALIKAKKAGVRVEIILDKSNRPARYSAADFTAHMGIPTYIDAAHAIAHNKIMIIDRETVITGSFNFTKAPEEHNAEKDAILCNPAFPKKILFSGMDSRKDCGHDEERGQMPLCYEPLA